MSVPANLARSQPVLVWLGAVLGLGVVGLVVVSLTHAQFLDCSVVETHVSANTPLGWTVALVSSGLPILVAAALRPAGKQWLLPASVLVTLAEFSVWVWLLNPGGCDWM